ncbi:MAG: PilN domain-containing protein [Candidatus Omnitrophica bacterium]|nr:PilN domain-containing protein [Candidatus Omnitrophota bacterium]
MRRINLIPHDDEFKPDIPWISYVLIICVLGCLFSFLSWNQQRQISYYENSLKAKEEDYSFINNQVFEQKTQYQSLLKKQDIQAEQKEIVRMNLEFILKARHQGAPLSMMLLKLGRLLPDDIWLENLELSDNKITIKGSSPDNVLISTLMRKLDESDFFFNTQFEYMQLNEGESNTDMLFSIVTQIAK